jgi:hypothetical protein
MFVMPLWAIIVKLPNIESMTTAANTPRAGDARLAAFRSGDPMRYRVSARN